MLSRVRHRLRRLLGRTPGDWAGPDGAREAARSALPVRRDDAFDVVVFEDEVSSDDPRLRRLTEEGHRVFRAAGDSFAVLDGLRREHQLGATLVLRRAGRASDAVERLGWVSQFFDSATFPAGLSGAFPFRRHP